MNATRVISDEARKAMSRGGKAKVPKGTALLPPEKRAEVSRLGVEARKRNAAKLDA